MYFIVPAPTVSYGRCDDRYDHETGKSEKIRHLPNNRYNKPQRSTIVNL